MSVDVMSLRRDSTAFNMTINRRNQIEVFAAGLVVAIFGVRAMASGNTLEIVGSWLIVAGAIVVAGVMLARGHTPTSEPAHSTRAFLEQRREELAYQARLLRWVPVWYVGPLLPGLAVLSVDAWFTYDAIMRYLGLFVLPSVVVISVVIGLNLKAARDLQSQADAVPTLD